MAVTHERRQNHPAHGYAAYGPNYDGEPFAE